jgi:hypothetical protein
LASDLKIKGGERQTHPNNVRDHTPEKVIESGIREITLSVVKQEVMHDE